MAIRLTIADNEGIRLTACGNSTPLTLNAGDTTVVSENDYNQLQHKPSINGVELNGNKTTEDLGIEAGVSSFNGQTGNVTYTAPVTSVNGRTGAVTIAVPTKTSQLTNDSGFITSAPVTSVNGQTGAVTVTEGLAPLIGTTSTVTPHQVMTALGEGRGICITGTAAFPIGLFQLPVELKFTAWERITDTANGNYGQVADVVVSQCMYNLACWTIAGGVYQGQPLAWTISYNGLVSDTLSINGHLLEEGHIDLTASEVGALPSSTVIPSKTSDLTNDSGFITLSDLPIYNGGVS